MSYTYDTFRAVTDSKTATAVMTCLEQEDGSRSDEEAAAWAHLRALDDDEWEPVRRALVDHGGAEGRAVIEAVEEDRW